MSREAHLVELVNEAGMVLGESTVEDAHRQPGQLHRAFSVMLLDDADRVLVQRRAGTKTRFPLRWANSCCGHPSPGESVAAAASRRLDEELGVRAAELTEIGVYTYRADDPGTGRVEHEYDHVLISVVDEDVPLLPDPTEVAEVRWVHVPDLLDGIASAPGSYAPWLAGVLAVLDSAGPIGDSA